MSEQAAEEGPTTPEPASPEELQQLEKQIAEPVSEEAPRPGPKGVILCIPALNDEKQVGKFVSKALKFVNKVIVCDDGSLDETGAKAREAGAFVIYHREGLGLGKSMSDLIEEAMKSNPQIVITMSLKRVNDPAFIPELIEPIRKDEADICIGVHEQVGVPMAGAELMALNSKALAARSRDDFFSTTAGDDQMALAAASGLRVKLRTFKSAALTPASGGRTKEGVPLGGRWNGFLHKVLVDRPFSFIGAPGITLIVVGLSLMALATRSYVSTLKLDVPMVLGGGTALIVGLILLVEFSILYVIRQSPKERPEPQK
jgi:hypothetical protein